MKTLENIKRAVTAFREEFARNSHPAAARQPALGIALGGGFARGLAHIGVLKVLEEENIPISYIAGTSVGAVLGAAYASGVSAKELAEIAVLVRFKDFARWTVSRYGLCTNDRMEALLKRVLKCKTFEELRIPLAVCATDFASGEDVVFRSGPLIDAVRASSAYPGMFLPVNVNGRLMVDGLLGHSVPAIPLRQMGADRVISVYLSAHWVNLKGPRHVFDVIGQCFSIAQAKMASVWQGQSDVVLEPNIASFGYDDFARAPELVQAGELVAREALPTIKSWFQEAPSIELKPHPEKIRGKAPIPKIA